MKLSRTLSFFFLFNIEDSSFCQKICPDSNHKHSYNYVTNVTNIYFVIFVLLIVTRNYYDLDRHKTVTKELLIYINLVILMFLICHRFVTKKICLQISVTIVLFSCSVSKLLLFNHL